MTYVRLLAEVRADCADARRDARGLFYADTFEEGQRPSEAFGEQYQGHKLHSSSSLEVCGVEADLRHGDESGALVENDGCPRRNRDEVEERAGSSCKADRVDMRSDFVIACVEGLVRGSIRANGTGVRIGVPAKVDKLLAQTPDEAPGFRFGGPALVYSGVEGGAASAHRQKDKHAKMTAAFFCFPASHLIAEGGGNLRAHKSLDDVLVARALEELSVFGGVVVPPPDVPLKIW